MIIFWNKFAFINLKPAKCVIAAVSSQMQGHSAFAYLSALENGLAMGTKYDFTESGHGHE